MCYILKYTYLNFFPLDPMSDLFHPIPPPYRTGGKKGKEGFIIQLYMVAHYVKTTPTKTLLLASYCS